MECENKKSDDQSYTLYLKKKNKTLKIELVALSIAPSCNWEAFFTILSKFREDLFIRSRVIASGVTACFNWWSKNEFQIKSCNWLLC